MEDTQLYTMLLGIKYPWLVTKVQVDMALNRVDVWVQEAEGARFFCAVCRQEAPVHDHTEEQVWRHLDTCQLQTFVHARLPRTKCHKDGVKQILSPWAESRSQFTRLFESRLINTLKECDVTGVTRLWETSWDEAWGVMQRAVTRGLSRKKKRVPQYMGVDEKSIGKGQNYESIVCDLDHGTVEYVVDNREQKSLEAYYQQFRREELEQVEAIAMDMWDPYIAATKSYVPDADKKIVFDRYHAMTQVTKAVDKVRRNEHKMLSAREDFRLKGTRYLWLWNEANVPEWRREEFAGIKDAKLKTSRAWAIKEAFREFWSYTYRRCAEKYFRAWYFWATHSRLTPIITAAKTLKVHFTNLLTYFEHRITNATSEGINSKIQMIKLMACGYRNREHYKAAIYFHCGGLDLYPRAETA
jgi:transposase